MFLNPEVASALSFSQSQSEDLILVLAQKELLEDGTNYQGLSNQYRQLSSLELEDRIKRYATDISKSNNATQVDILSISKNQSPIEIADYLKQVYLGNSEQFPEANLLGIVLVGAIPIPRLQLDASSKFSIYPFVDFVNPVFAYEPRSDEFVLNSDNLQDPEPEIFHGVIDPGTPQELAAFLDKNHLYYEGHPDFSQIEKKMFVAEPSFAIESLNQDLASRYANFLTLGRYLVDNKISAELLSQVTGEDQPVPDQFAKDLLDKQYVEFLDLFQGAIKDIQYEVEQTGRYTDCLLYTSDAADE